jgi:hypothetical protein
MVCSLPVYSPEPLDELHPGGTPYQEEVSPFHPRLHRSVGCVVQAAGAFIDLQIATYSVRVRTAVGELNEMLAFLNGSACSRALTAASVCSSLGSGDSCTVEAASIYRDTAPSCRQALSVIQRAVFGARLGSLGARLGGVARDRLVALENGLGAARLTVEEVLGRDREARAAAADAEERRAAAAERAARDARDADAAAARAECIASCRRRSDAATCDRVCGSR